MNRYTEHSAKFIATGLLAALAACGGESSEPYAQRDDHVPSYPPNERYDREPFETYQWWFEQARVLPAQERATGRGITVAIVNNGIWTEHPEFQRNDGTAKFVRGITILRPPIDLADTADPPPRQEPCSSVACGQRNGRPLTTEYPHGTATAAVIGGERNRYGMAGVAPDAKLMPVAVMVNQSANLYDIADGIRWAVNHGADVVNVSAAAPQGYEAAADAGVLHDFDVPAAIEYARSRNVVVVAGAGAERSPLCSFAGYPTGALCVLPTSRDEMPAMQANLGASRELAVVSAPGGAFARNFEDGMPVDEQSSHNKICGDYLFGAGHPYGAVPDSDTIGCVGPGSRIDYVAYSGSYAAGAVVAGVAAQLRELGCDADQTVDIILRTARLPAPEPNYQPPPQQASSLAPDGQLPLPLELPSAWLPAYGHGIVDADAATARALAKCR